MSEDSTNKLNKLWSSIHEQQEQIKELEERLTDKENLKKFKESEVAVHEASNLVKENERHSLSMV